MENKNQMERTNILLSKLNDLLVISHKTLKAQPSTQHSDAAIKLVATLGLLTSTVIQLNDKPEAFSAVIDGLDELLEEKFFSQIHGKKESSPITISEDPLESLLNKMNQTEETGQPEGIRAHIVGLGDPDDVPMNVRLKLAQVLKGLGFSKDDINASLKLGGKLS